MTSVKSYFCIVISALFFTACASTHPGVMGKTVSSTNDLHLVFSGEWNKDNSDDTNIFIDVTMENRSGIWAHIDQIDVEFPNEGNVAHNVIVGTDLKAWADSASIREKKSNHNIEMGIASLLAAGAILMVAAVASGGKGGGSSSAAQGLATAGMAAYGVGVTAGTVRAVKMELKRVERGFTVPESHIYAPVTIPSNGFAQRWVLVNIPAGVKNAAKMMRVKIHTVEGGDGVIDIPLIQDPGPQRI